MAQRPVVPPPSSGEGSTPPLARSAAGLISALVCAAEGVVLLGFCAFYLYELVLGEGDDAARVVMSIVLMGLVGVGLIVMARAWWRGLVWPRTPTILWNLLLLPVTWSMWEAGFWGAWPLGLTALTGIVSAWRGSGSQPSDTVL